MTFKHQSECYRTFNGVKFVNYADVLDDAVKLDVEQRQRAGQRVRIRKHPGGYYQAFIHPDDLALYPSA